MSKLQLIIIILLLCITSIAHAGKLLTLLPDKPKAPEFKLLDMDDNVHQLSDYLGKPVIINFWATWCPPCRTELPSMNRAFTKIKTEGIAMIAVNVGENEDTIFSFMGNYPINFTVLRDESGKIINQWPIKGLPTTFILNPEGKLVYRAIGGREWDDEKILNKVRSLKLQREKL
ncbi:MAG: TlpA disulfide reductase family protein [Candidatus Marithrix sp.]